MKALLAIARKELLSFFFAPMAYIVIVSFLFMNGFIFWWILGELSRPTALYQETPMYAFLGGTILFWLFLTVQVPVITMKLGAEEFKTGTVETLMTAPVSDLEVVLGKYLGALTLFAAVWLPTCLYAAVLSAYSRVDWGPVVCGYLGVFLVGAYFVAVGLFTSLMSRNQLVAAVLAILLIVVIWLFPVAISMATTSDLSQKLVGYLNLFEAVQTMNKGMVDTRAVLYMCSGAAFFLALAYQALQTRRWR